MKRVVLVAAHFTPSNLAGVHRSRLWAQHLPEFGWEPTILTTHYRFYEERLDWDLHELVSKSLRVVRTAAIPTKPVRLIGDIGVRALPFHYAALGRLARSGAMDFLHITIPSHYSAVLGRMVEQTFGTPYGIDYIDPWVHNFPGSDRPLTKAWGSARLARLLEPWAVAHASLITGVAPLYYEDVLARNPALRSQAVTAAMPYGFSEQDFTRVRETGRKTFIFDPTDGNFHMMYAGAMLPKAYEPLDRLLSAIALLKNKRPELAGRLRLHFVGTGKSPDDPRGHNIAPHIARHGVADLVDEHPARIPYVDVLNHLCHASAALILGSTERHYTPSKAFQSVQARRPIFAVLHKDSTAAQFLKEANAADVVEVGDSRLPSDADLCNRLAAFIQDDSYRADDVRWDVFEHYSARAGARELAHAMDRALEGHAASSLGSGPAPRRAGEAG